MGAQERIFKRRQRPGERARRSISLWNSRKGRVCSESARRLCDNADNLFIELQQLCENNLQPPVRIECAQIDGFERGPVLIVQVPSAWNKPHSVSTSGQRQFYKRYDVTSREMSMAEIRRAFLETAELEERIRTFRRQRIDRLKNSEAPVPMMPDRLIVCHIIPVGTVASNIYINIDFQPPHTHEWLQPLGINDHFYSGYNIDGRYTYWGSWDNNQGVLEKAYAYAQLFRNGIVEGAICYHSIHPGKIDPVGIAKRLCKSFRSGWQRGMQDSTIEGPFVLALSLLGWKGSELMQDPDRFYGQYYPPIQSDTLMLPEIMLETLQGEPHEFLAPLFDFLWQTCGLPKCDDSYKRKLAQ